MNKGTADDELPECILGAGRWPFADYADPRIGGLQTVIHQDREQASAVLDADAAPRVPLVPRRNVTIA